MVISTRNNFDIFILPITGIGSSLFKVVKYEGIPGLYRGNGAMMVRIFPYGAIQFVAFEIFKEVSSIFKVKSGSGQNLSMKVII